MAHHGEGVLKRAAAGLALASAAAPLVSISASHAALAGAAACLLAARERLRIPPIKLPLALFLGGTLLSLAVSGHMAEGWPQVRKFYVFLTLAVVASAVRSVAGARRFVYLWAAVGTASAVYGLVQFAGRLEAARRPGAGNLYEALVGDRITGFMSLWMTFGGQLAIVLAMLGGWLLFAEEAKRRRALLAVCGLVMGAALVLALTRGPWMGAAAGGMYLLWAWKPKALAAVPVAAALALLAAPAALRDRAVSVVRPQSKYDSNQHRVVLWRTGWEMVKAHPWFGIGPEQVNYQFERYVPADIPQPLPWGWRKHLHNVYLQYAAERGVPVLLAFLWLLGKAMYDFRRAAARAEPGRGNRKAVIQGCLAALIAVAVGGLFEHNLGDSEVLQLFLAVIALGYGAIQAGSGEDRLDAPAAGDDGVAGGAEAGV